jgi:hypothetical protein
VCKERDDGEKNHQSLSSSKEIPKLKDPLGDLVRRLKLSINARARPCLGCGQLVCGQCSASGTGICPVCGTNDKTGVGIETRRAAIQRLLYDQPAGRHTPHLQLCLAHTYFGPLSGSEFGNRAKVFFWCKLGVEQDHAPAQHDLVIMSLVLGLAASYTPNDFANDDDCSSLISRDGVNASTVLSDGLCYSLGQTPAAQETVTEWSRDQWPDGARVRLHGLSAAQLNGKFGCIGTISRTDRWMKFPRVPIHIDGLHGVKSIKVFNVILI